MLIQEEDAQILKQLGFSISQAKVYFALLSLGKSNGKTIWQYSGVARQDIYRILLELQEMGFIEKRLDIKPAEYEAISIQDGLSSLLTHKIQEYKEIEQKTVNLLQRLKSNIETQLSEEAQFRFISPKASLQKRKCCMRNAQKSTDIITSWKRFLQLTSNQMHDLMGAMNRGVTYRWIISEPEDKKTIPKTTQNYMKKPHCKVRLLYHSSPDIALAIYDGKQVLIATDAKKPYYLDSAMLWSNNPTIATIIQCYFNSLWAETKIKPKTQNCYP